MRGLWIIVAALGVALSGAACKRAGGGGDAVVTSIFPIHDLVKRVAGDAVDVELLLTPGKGAHNFNPSTQQAKTAAKAKVAFVVGLQLDPWAVKTVEAGGGKAAIVKLGERIEARAFEVDRVGGHRHAAHDDDEDDHDEDDHGEHDDEEDHDEDEDEDDHGEDEEHEAHDHGGLDPHVWLSVPNAIAMVGVIAEELSVAFPDHAETFEANAAALVAELEKLDAEIRKTVAGFATKQLVTFHGSFGYFATEYGLEIVAVIEPFPGKQPSASYIKDVLEAIADEPVAALYTEPQLDKRPAEVLAKEAGLPLKELDPIGGLEGRASYVELMRFNLAALAETMK